jgi:uncharacterized protein YjbJ (UPF0337 family)
MVWQWGQAPEAGGSHEGGSVQMSDDYRANEPVKRPSKRSPGAQSSRDTISGKAKELGGKVQKTAGKVTGDKSMQARGKVQESGGKLQKGAGKAERKADDVART